VRKEGGRERGITSSSTRARLAQPSLIWGRTDPVRITEGYARSTELTCDYRGKKGVRGEGGKESLVR